jgi:hypothetical protein
MNPTNGSEKYIRFATNIAQEVALKYATGLPAPSAKPGFSDQVCYSLCDGRKMYVPPFAADLIARHGIEPGEPFSIGKFEVRTGQKRAVNWLVQRIERVDPIKPETPFEADLRRSAEIANARKPGAPVQWPRQEARTAPVGPIPTPPRSQPVATARQQPAARTAAVPMTGGPGIPNGTAPAPRAAPPPAPLPRSAPPHPSGVAAKPVPTKVPMDRAMLEFLLIAGRQTKAAEQQLGSEGGSVRFDNRDVAALATTLLIQSFNAGWVTWGGVK